MIMPIMARHIPVTVGVAALLAAVASGCGGPARPSSNKTETFSGTAQPANAGPTHSFDVPNTGEFTVKLTAFSPGNVYVDFVWGLMGGGACQPLTSNPVYGNSYIGRTVLSGSVLTKGQYCVFVFDPANVLGQTPVWPIAQTYTVEVSHP
jgi:hypothetical protein